MFQEISFNSEHRIGPVRLRWWLSWMGVILVAVAAFLLPSRAAAASVSYDQPYRPQYHFTPSTGWMNDPNGLVYYQGEYHLFFQYNPQALHWGPIMWGHAVSRDLVHWTQLPIALYPDNKGNIFSGSAVVDEHNTSGFFPHGSGLVAIFTYDKNSLESQAIAYSRDRGRTWTKYAGNPVIPNPGVKDFRDPKVFWYAPTKRWVMVVAGGEVNFYSSADLTHWTHESTLNGVYTEMPDLFPLAVNGNSAQVMWVLNLGGTRYYIGRFDGHRFVPETDARRVDWGKDFYATQLWNNFPGGRRVYLGWMNNWDYAQVIPTSPWRSAMTVPRELGLISTTDGLQLVQQPVRELNQLRYQPVAIPPQTLQPGSNVLAGQHGTSYEINTTIDIGSTIQIVFQLRTGSGQQTTLGYDVRQASLYLDRTRSGDASFSSDFATRTEAPLGPIDQHLIKLRILVDRSSVEVFGNDGRAVLTDQIFPQLSSDGMRLDVQGGTARLVDLHLYQLHTIHS
jgi:sucrose-6-phosphate hydrolase SacC (GH32 family)